MGIIIAIKQVLAVMTAIAYLWVCKPCTIYCVEIFDFDKLCLCVYLFSGASIRGYSVLTKDVPGPKETRNGF